MNILQGRFLPPKHPGLALPSPAAGGMFRPHRAEAQRVPP